MRMNVESFNFDYIKVKVFYVCVVDWKIGVYGDVIIKYDVCFK